MVIAGANRNQTSFKLARVFMSKLNHTPSKNNLVELETVGAPLSNWSKEEKKRLKHALPELLWLERLISQYSHRLSVKLEDHIPWQGINLPFYTVSLGNSNDKSLPVFLLTGGLHGIERIGTQVILAWLNSVLERMEWDSSLRNKLQRLHIVMVPIVNPVGMFSNRRANGNGVDLNRNAPVVAEGSVPLLGGGHRISRFLPWYRGRSGAELEKENKLLSNVVHRELFSRAVALSLDLHSGFGMHDRVWFPYAYRKKLIGSIENYLALKLLWERCYPHHSYIFEPQCLHYLSHGDMWDYFYWQAKNVDGHTFVPLTLEMGSWAWVKKRPHQIFNIAGLFNPQKAHRHARVLRRHLAFLDFLISASIENQTWLPEPDQKKVLKQAANVMWN